MRIFIFEDEKYRIEFFTKLVKLFEADDYFITDNPKVAESKIKSEKWDVAFLDHDIGGTKYTGLSLAKFIYREKIEIPQIFIHSMNPVGADDMKGFLQHAVIKPFSEIVSLYSKELH